jgi:hypothetical protein
MAYTAWAKWKVGGWKPVAEGVSQAEAHRALLAVIHEQGKVPTASAVLPAGVNPPGLTNAYKDS